MKVLHQNKKRWAWRIAGITFLALVLLSSMAYSSSITGSAKMLGGASSSVPHCQAQTSDETFVTDSIDTIDATVECDQTGSYTIQITVTSGASSSTNQSSASLTANTPTTVTIDVSPNVDTSANDKYDVTYKVTLQ